MTKPIKIDQVLAMAIDMEKTGQAFYEALALACGNRDIVALCSRLAKAEVSHGLILSRMRDQLPTESRARPLTEEVAESLHSMVKASVVPQPAEVRQVALRGQFKDAVMMAIGMEQGSIHFYEGILRSVQPEQAVIVEGMITEEKKHLLDLKAGLARIELDVVRQTP